MKAVSHVNSARSRSRVWSQIAGVYPVVLHAARMRPSRRPRRARRSASVCGRGGRHPRSVPRGTPNRTFQSLVSYRAVRRLSVVARGGKMKADLNARTTLDPVNGFQFKVLEESGLGMLRSRVLHGALEAERDAKRREKGGSWRADALRTTASMPAN